MNGGTEVRLKMSREDDRTSNSVNTSGVEPRAAQSTRVEPALNSSEFEFSGPPVCAVVSRAREDGGDAPRRTATEPTMR